MRVVSRNRFARVYSVQLPPGTVGVDVKFRNESKDSGRIEVAAVRGSVADAGVVAGDILVAYGGYALPVRASVVELEEIMKEHETMNQSVPVDVLMWRNEYKFIREKRGDEVLVAFGKHARSTNVVWASVDEDSSIAIAKGPSSSFEQGLVVIGINHDPLPDGLEVSDFSRRLEQREKTGSGPIILNCWRHTDRKLHAQILKRCQQACIDPPPLRHKKKTTQAADKATKTPQLSSWGVGFCGRLTTTTTCCCCASPTPPVVAPAASSSKSTTTC